MRHFLYLSLIERLKQLTDPAGEPVIKTFDLWNEQVEFIEQEEVFDTPAVFIEFLPVKWTNLGGGVQRAEATIRLHIVTPWNGSTRDGNPLQRQSLERFDLLDRIDHHLFNIMGSNGRTEFNMFRRTASSTNHNHEELVEDISDYTCMVMDNIRKV
ncbi:hypothetical protein [Bacteroides cellulosilyticus]|uniref:hypothetical protein n=1 Tax=Bacteroides cellulosilyticus TaxID=246787 RepID=UPI0032EBDEE9